MREGCLALGWHIDAMPRNVRGCDQGETCGYCGLGCRLGAKQSVTKTWLSDAAGVGARMVIKTRAKRVFVEDGEARGVEAGTIDGHRVTVRSRAVVAACGAIQTPALLKRSGLANRNIGQHLKLHPATVVWGLFDDEKKPWEGAMQALYSDQHRDLNDGYGLKYETAAMHPHLVVGFWPWRGARPALRPDGGARNNAGGIGMLLRDRDGGEVRVGGRGARRAIRPVGVRPGPHACRGGRGGPDPRGRRCQAGLRELAGEVGVYDPGGEGDRAGFMAECDACGWGPGQTQLGSFRIMGSARMGGSPNTSACTRRARPGTCAACGM